MFKVGDKVSFTVTVKKGSGYHISSRQGKIVVMMEELGKAVVKYRNGKTTIVRTTSLRSSGEKSELTEAFLKLGENLK